MSKHLVDQLRAIADRIEAADQARAAALDELWHIQTVDIEQPADGHPSAGAAGIGEAADAPASPPAPIEAPGQAREDGAEVPKRRARAKVAPPSEPSSARTGTPAPATDAAGSDQPKEEDDAGRVTCPECGGSFKPAGLPPHRAKKHGVVGHGRLRADGTRRVNGTGVAAHGTHTFLCNRCPERFTSRELLTAHYQKGHPPSGSAPTKPFGAQPAIEYGDGGGLV